jgi:hypothetical protein
VRDPDVTPVGFAATDGPAALVRHRRNPLWLALCVLLAGAGLAGILAFVLSMTSTDVDDDAVAHGQVAALDGPLAESVRYASPEGGDFTVWLKTDGIGNSVTRETIVAATNCEAVFANGSAKRFRGAIQGSNVTLGNRSTVGTFKAPAGTMNVSCHQERFGRRRGHDRLREQRPFLVARGKPPGDLLGWIGLFGGIGLLILAVVPGSRWLRGALRPV